MALFFNLLKIFTDFRRPTDSAIRKTGRNIIRKAEIHKKSVIFDSSSTSCLGNRYAIRQYPYAPARGPRHRTPHSGHPPLGCRPCAGRIAAPARRRSAGYRRNRARFRKAGTERGPIRRIPVPTGTGPPIRPTRRAPLRAGIRRGDARTTGLPATGSDLPRIHRLA